MSAPANTRPRTQIPFNWPDPPVNIVLVEPEIPQNTGNIARLCAATGSVLHLIEPLGFQLTERAVKRAGLDYWDAVEIRRHPNLAEFRKKHPGDRMFYFSTGGKKITAKRRTAPATALFSAAKAADCRSSCLKRFRSRSATYPYGWNTSAL